MPGIRIFHPTERSVTFTLVDGSRRYSVPYECGFCHKIHDFKTYHITLDSFGFSIVSTEIWGHLQRMNSPFRLANEVENPPVQTISLSLQSMRVIEIPASPEERIEELTRGKPL